MTSFLVVAGVLAMLVYLLIRGRRKPQQSSYRRQQASRHGAHSLPAVVHHESKLFEESEYSRLNKQATAFKKAGDMVSAVSALRHAKALCGSQYYETRLAKYLQAAGFFDMAMLEIEWLLGNSDLWAQNMFGHQPASVIECQRTGLLARIHADAALICKRAKRPDLQAIHQQLYEQHIEISKQLRPVSDADAKAKLAEWEVARQEGPKAMAAFSKKYPGRSSSPVSCPSTHDIRSAETSASSIRLSDAERVERLKQIRDMRNCGR